MGIKLVDSRHMDGLDTQRKTSFLDIWMGINRKLVSVKFAKKDLDPKQKFANIIEKFMSGKLKR